jgi:hypothetical protein
LKKTYSILMLLVCLGSSVQAQSVQAQEALKVSDYPLELEMIIVEIDSEQPDDPAAIANDRERLRKLLAEGKARLISSTRLHTRAGKPVSFRNGLKIPIQVGALPTASFAAEPRANSSSQNVRSDRPFAAFSPIIQYEEIGLLIEAHPTILSDELIDVNLRVEIKDLDRSTGNLTPSFAIKYLNEYARLRLNEQVILLGASGNRAKSIAEIAAAPPGSGNSFNFVVLLTARRIE